MNIKCLYLPAAKIEDAWWRGNIYTSYRSLEEMPITDVVYTDATSREWRATYKEWRINERWADAKKLQSISTWELLVIKFAIKLFFKEYKNSHIRIMSENVSSVAHISNMSRYVFMISLHVVIKQYTTY